MTSITLNEKETIARGFEVCGITKGKDPSIVVRTISFIAILRVGRQTTLVIALTKALLRRSES